MKPETRGVLLIAAPVLMYLGLFWVFLPGFFYMVGGSKGSLGFGFGIAVGATAILILAAAIFVVAGLLYLGLCRIKVDEEIAAIPVVIFTLTAAIGGIFFLVMNFGKDYDNLFRILAQVF